MLAIVTVGCNVYGGGEVTIGECLIWVASLSSGSLSESSDGYFSGSSKDGKPSSTDKGCLISWRTSARL